MNFSMALEHLKTDTSMARTGWNGKDMYIKIKRVQAGSAMTLPYIYMKTADQELVPWLASQTDILAEDWEIARG